MSNLSSTQLQTLKDDINANTDPAVVAARNDGSNNVIVSWYNTEASDFWVLRKSMTRKEVVDAIVWATDYAALKDDLEGIEFIIKDDYQPEEENARHALDQMMTGAASSKNAVLSAATMASSRVTKLSGFHQVATGPGGGNGTTQGAPAISLVNEITLQNVRDALALP